MIDLEPIKSKYAAIFAQRGDSAKGVAFGSEEEAMARYDFLIDMIPAGMSVLDCGCGPGRFYARLRSPRFYARLRSPWYTGYDMVPEYVAHARQAYPEGRFLDGPPNTPHAIVLAHGYYGWNGNNEREEWMRYVQASLASLWKLTTVKLIFDFPSPKNETKKEHVVYASAYEMTDFCDSLSPDWSLHHRAFNGYWLWVAEIRR